MPLTIQRIVPLKKSNLAGEIIGQMQRMILSGELAAGHKLPPERELAQAFNVNRATIREALKRLESLDLIEIRHGDGLYARNYLHSTNLDLLRAMLEQGGAFKRDVVQSLLDIRRIIVPEMAALVAKTRTAEDLRALRAVVMDETEMTVQEKDLAVHRVIAAASHNLPYLILLNFLHDATRQLIEEYFEDGPTKAKTKKFHEDLYEAIRSRRPQVARQVMLEALARAAKRTIALTGKAAAKKAAP